MVDVVGLNQHTDTLLLGEVVSVRIPSEF
jgi:hypothetical protein